MAPTDAGSSNGNEPAKKAKPGQSAKERYTVLTPRRDAFLRRGRVCAELTLPSILPPEGYTQTSDLLEPNQGFGARLVTSLSARLSTALLPPGQKAHKLEVPQEVLIAQGEQAVPEDIDKQLTLAEDLMQREIEKSDWRASTFMMFQHLIVTGNYMEQTLPDNTLRGYRLDQYVVVRDPQGTMTEFVIQENLTPASVTGILRDLLTGKEASQQSQTVQLYTWGRLVDGVWFIHQEFEDQNVPDSDGEYDVPPFRALRWESVLGEDYGRGKVEEHLGDFRSLDGFSKNARDGAAMASRNITMIRPNASGGLNLRRRMSSANNGDVLVGNPEDVVMLQFENQAGLQITFEFLNGTKRELGQAFLLNSSAQRDAERVTAFELRKLIEEIEQVLGGVFSSLQRAVQFGRLERLVFQMRLQEKLPPWPDGVVEPTMLTGLEALGRERDVDRVATALQFIGTLPDQAQGAINWDALLGKLFNGLGIPNGVLTSQEQEEQRQQLLAEQAAAGGAERAIGNAQVTDASEEQVQ